MYAKDITNNFIFLYALIWFDKTDIHKQLSPQFKAKILTGIAVYVNNSDFLLGAKMRFFGDEAAAVAGEEIDKFFKILLDIVIIKNL